MPDWHSLRACAKHGSYSREACGSRDSDNGHKTETIPGK